jgi:hypothetical protein
MSLGGYGAQAGIRGAARTATVATTGHIGDALMKKIMERIAVLAVSLLLLAIVSVAHAQVWVDPYVRKNGTEVQGQYRSNPDGNPYNNWSSPGNGNPYTGKEATGNPNRYLDRYQNRNGSVHDPYSNNPYNYNPYTAYRW